MFTGTLSCSHYLKMQNKKFVNYVAKDLHIMITKKNKIFITNWSKQETDFVIKQHEKILRKMQRTSPMLCRWIELTSSQICFLTPAEAKYAPTGLNCY